MAKAKPLKRKLPPPKSKAKVVKPDAEAKRGETYRAADHADQLDPYTMPNRTGLLAK